MSKTSYIEEKKRLKESIKQHQNNLKGEVGKGTDLLSIGKGMGKVSKVSLGKYKRPIIIGVVALSTAVLVGGMFSRLASKKRKKLMPPPNGQEGYYAPRPVQYAYKKENTIMGRVKNELATFIVSLLKETIAAFVQELPYLITSSAQKQKRESTESNKAEKSAD